jgi:hypothetical protein
VYGRNWFSVVSIEGGCQILCYREIVV